MGKLFKNLKPYWKSVLVIFVLLVVQAFCDLSLPQYTSDIIDTGIQNSGVAHILPEKITAEEFDNAQLFMTEEEQNQCRMPMTARTGKTACRKRNWTTGQRPAGAGAAELSDVYDE